MAFLYKITAWYHADFDLWKVHNICMRKRVILRFTCRCLHSCRLDAIGVCFCLSVVSQTHFQ